MGCKSYCPVPRTSWLVGLGAAPDARRRGGDEVANVAAVARGGRAASAAKVPPEADRADQDDQPSSPEEACTAG